MERISKAENAPDLARLGNTVPDGYAYHKKKIAAGVPLSLDGAYLKWYDIYPSENEITRDQVLETRAFIHSEAQSGRLKFEGELGFVILHRAGDYLLLMVNTWRNTNEVWESVYARKAVQAEAYAPVMSGTDHKATYCVWELGAVWHERNAWVRFIQSGRDVSAKQMYIQDVFSGEV